MSTTLFVDAACDLPQSFLTKYDVKVPPATILYDGHSMPDYRDTEKTISLYESGVLDKGHESDTAPTSAQTVQKLMEKAIKQGHQEILIQTVSHTRCPTFEHATEAANRAQKTAVRNHDKTFPIKTSVGMTWRSRPCLNTPPIRSSTTCCRLLSASATPDISTKSPHCPSSSDCKQRPVHTKTT